MKKLKVAQMKSRVVLATIFAILSMVCANCLAADAGGIHGGGGEGIAAQYSQVSTRTISAAKLICRGMERPDPGALKACSYVTSAETLIGKMKVEPRSRDSVLGSDDKPRDGGNNGYQTVFLDTDRWTDKQNETDPNKIPDARYKQVQLSIHEPLVLVGAEKNDEYSVSGKLMDMLLKNNFSLDAVVGKPFVPSPPKIVNNIFSATSTLATCTGAFLVYSEQFDDQFGSVKLKAAMAQEATAAAQDKCYHANFEVCEVLHTEPTTSSLVSCAEPYGYVMKATVRGLHTR